MHSLSTIVRVLTVVDRSLRRQFPADYDKRCMYAAFATFELLRFKGLDAKIVGGDFLAFVVATSGQRAGLQGFGVGSDGPSHYWVEVSDTIVDVGPHYLPRGSSFPAAEMPLVAWPIAARLPAFLRYRPHVQYSPAVQLSSTPEIAARKDAFVAVCMNRLEAQSGQPKPPHWLLTGDDALIAAARRRDFWAQNAIRFERKATIAELPF